MVKRSAVDRAAMFFKHCIKRNIGRSKNLLLHFIEVFWIHNINIICNETSNVAELAFKSASRSSWVNTALNIVCEKDWIRHGKNRQTFAKNAKTFGLINSPFGKKWRVYFALNCLFWHPLLNEGKGKFCSTFCQNSLPLPFVLNFFEEKSVPVDFFRVREVVD